MAQNKYKRAMVTLGVMNITNGILLPILWGISWIWAYYSATSVIGTEVWGGVLFLIPAGILGIIAGVSNNRGVAIASMVMNILGSIVALVIIIIAAIVAAGDSRYGYAGDILVDVLIILLGLCEGVVCIVASVYSGLICKMPRPSPAATVIYNTAYPGGPQQYPGQPVQTQYVGQPAQIQYAGPGGQPAAAQIQYAGPVGQPMQYVVGEQAYAAPSAQAQYAAPPPTEEKTDGPPEM